MNFKPSPLDVSEKNIRYRLCDEANCRALATKPVPAFVDGLPALLLVVRQLCDRHARMN